MIQLRLHYHEMVRLRTRTYTYTYVKYLPIIKIFTATISTLHSGAVSFHVTRIIDRMTGDRLNGLLNALRSIFFQQRRRTGRGNSTHRYAAYETKAKTIISISIILKITAHLSVSRMLLLCTT